MACGFNLRTGRFEVDERAVPGGTWYYDSVQEITVTVDGVSTTLNQGSQVGSNDDPLIIFDDADCGNIFAFKYLMSNYCGLDNLEIRTTFDFQCGSTGGCTISDATINVCPDEPDIVFDNEIIKTGCDGSENISWTLISGSDVGIDWVNNTLDPWQYSDETVVIQGMIGSNVVPTINGCDCGMSVANLTINIYPNPVPLGGWAIIQVCE